MNASLFGFKERVLFIAGARIELPCDIGEIVHIRGLVVVRIDPPIGQVFNRNVFAYTQEGVFVWQIEESPHGTESDKPYIAISKNEFGSLVASNWNGVDYLVDLDNGSIRVNAFNK